MKITYIYHSSYSVEFEEEKVVLIFDYYKGTLPLFDKDADIFMFVSHKHFDHYSKKIFDLGNEYQNITFILPNEMKMNVKYMDRWNIAAISREKIKYVSCNEKYEFVGYSMRQPQLFVKTLKSTDAGVAYIVEGFEKTIYHAGDLNWWIWDEVPEEKNDNMTKRFQEEIAKISGLEIDVAFLPLDPRQEDKFYWGFDYFMKTCDVKNAFPMHLWEKYEIIDEFKKMDIADKYCDKIMNITGEGQVFEL